MDRDFLKKDNRQKYLILVFIGVLLVIFFVLKKDSFIASPAPGETVPVTFIPQRINIDFQLLEGEAIRKLQPFEEIKPFDGKIGRENPFLP